MLKMLDAGIFISIRRWTGGSSLPFLPIQVNNFFASGVCAILKQLMPKNLGIIPSFSHLVHMYALLFYTLGLRNTQDALAFLPTFAFLLSSL